MSYPQGIGRRPRNATPIPFPSTSQRYSNQQSFSPRSQYSDANYSFNNNNNYSSSRAEIRPTSPTYSEIEVVLDDGTLQRRTVSLSTTLDSQFHDYNDIHDNNRHENDTVQPSLNGTHHHNHFQHPHHSSNKQMMDKQPLLFDQRYKTNYHSIQPIQEDEGDSSSDSDDIFGDDHILNNHHQQYKYNKMDNYTYYNNQDLNHHHYYHHQQKSCWQPIIDFLNRMGQWMTLTPQQRTVLKCSLAYFVGSLFTFIPTLNALIGNNRVSSHLVATATVFFNPAKTLGGMVEAAAYGWGYTLFAVLVCLGSMLTTDFFIDHQLTIVAHSLSLLFWLAGSTFIISFLKAHWNKPPVLTASSLCFIIIFIIVVREGSANRGDFDTTRIEQITTAIATGTLVTIASCVLFWPSSATKKLQNDLEATLTSYKVLLKLLTKTFLLDDDLPEFKANSILQSAIESHRASFTSLQKSLKEAKLECLWNRQIRGCTNEYEQIIKSMQRLSQHVGGLRSSCGIQFNYINNNDQNVPNETSYIHYPSSSIMKQGMNSSSSINNNNKYASNSVVNSPMAASDTWSIKAGYRRRQLESEMRRQKSAAAVVAASYVTAPPFSLDKESMEIPSPLMNNDNNMNDLGLDPQQQQPSSPLPSDSFYITNDDASIKGQFNNQHDFYNNNNNNMVDGTLIDYIQTIRRPLKSLAYTCKRTIFHLQLKFSNLAEKSTPRLKNMSPDHYVLKENLLKAIELFEVSQSNANQNLKLHRDYQHQQQYIVPDNNNNNDDDHINTIPGEDVFLVYFFVYNMIEFAQELITLVDAVHQLSVTRTKKNSLFSYLFSKDHSSKKKVSKKPSLQGFTPNERNMKNTLHTPTPKTKWRKFFIQVWVTFSLFKLQKARYAIKCTIAAVLLALPAFLSSTYSIFREWRMEWALITLMVVMQPTVGSTNLVAVYRIFSTMLGCFTAMFFYMMFPANIYILPLLTWLFSIPNFWLILHNKHGKFGQFTLLAYNLVMLNKYNDREANNIEVWKIAIQRCVAILVGVILGLIATCYVWPYEARVELRKGLSDFLLRLAWIYQKLIALHSSSPPSSNNNNEEIDDYHNKSMIYTCKDGNEEEFTEQKSWTAYKFMELELGLQRSLIDLQTLLAQTPNEPRLKGAFPVSTYSDMLSSCQNIVDKFMSMRTVMFKEEWSIYVQQTFSATANKERREMVGNVLLYFYLLASALRLKTPLPPYLPPAHTAWQALIQKLRQDTTSLLLSKKNLQDNHHHHPSTTATTTTTTTTTATAATFIEQDQLHVFYFAYMLMMEDIIRELDRLGENMTLLFGSLIPDEQWKLLFEEASPIEQGDISRLNGLSITSNSF